MTLIRWVYNDMAISVLPVHWVRQRCSFYTGKTSLVTSEETFWIRRRFSDYAHCCWVPPNHSTLPLLAFCHFAWVHIFTLLSIEFPQLLATPFHRRPCTRAHVFPNLVTPFQPTSLFAIESMFQGVEVVAIILLLVQLHRMSVRGNPCKEIWIIYPTTGLKDVWAESCIKTNICR